MLHKTVDDSDTKSVSTKVAQTKPASFLTTSKREMYRNKTLTSKKVQQQINNLIILEPQFSPYIISQQIYFLQSSQNFVTVSDYHYTLLNQRAKPIMIARNAEAGSELLFWNARKPGLSTQMESLHKFSTSDYPAMLHINIAKYNSIEASKEVKDVYVEGLVGVDPIFFMTIENTKKAIIVYQLQPTKQHRQYQIWLIPTTKSNKTKSTIAPSPQSPYPKQHLYPTPSPPPTKQALKFPKSEHILSLINSQYGDSVQVITNQDIYELDFEPGRIGCKGIDLVGKLGRYLKVDGFSDQVRQVCYVVDGLRMLFLMESGYVGVVEAENIGFAANIHDLLAHAGKKQEGQFIKLHPLMEKIGVESDKGSLILVKFGENEATFQKKIQLPIHNNQIVSYKTKLLARHDQLILQTTSKKPNKLQVQLSTKNLLSPKNQFTKFYTSLLLQKLPKPLPAIKVLNSKSNSISCILRDNTVTFYRFVENFSADSQPIQVLFAKVFFQKPLYVSIDPYSSNVVILFKEFVKFFKFQYNDLSQFYTYNVRGVYYAAYSQSGQYVLIAVDDLLYFINPFTFRTERVMQAYGDIKSVRFHDDILYILLKNKINKNTSQVLTLQVYTWQDQNQQYTLLQQLKIEPTEAVLTESKFWIVASAKEFNVYRVKPMVYEYDDHIKNSSPVYKAMNMKKGNKVGVASIGGSGQVKSEVELVWSSKIKLSQSSQYPTCLTLSQQFGILLLGTSHGRLHQYLWPPSPTPTPSQPQQCHILPCSSTQLQKIHITPSFEHVYLYCKNSNILQMNIVQIVEGQEMPNVYIINPKTLYQGDGMVKYQFANREYLYDRYTAYIYEDIRQVNQAIEQLKFIQEKIKDDIQQHISKTTQKHQTELTSISNQKTNDVKHLKSTLAQAQSTHTTQNTELSQVLKQQYANYLDIKQKDKQKYEEQLLNLYEESSRLRGIIEKLKKEYQRERDVFFIQNQKVIHGMRQEGEKMEQQYKQKFKQIEASSFSFQKIQKQQAYKKLDQQLQQYKNSIRQSINMQLDIQQTRKQQLLGSNGYLQKQIINYKQRKEEFEALVMETNHQIDELYSDQTEYDNKKKYLVGELAKKERIIEEKERELVGIVGNGQLMKKIKETHQFQLKEYQQEFEPVLQKINVIQRNIQKMNDQILQQYLNKVQTQKSITSNSQTQQKLKQTLKQKLSQKLTSQTKITRFLAQLDFLLEHPLDLTLKDNLLALSYGDKLLIDEEQIRQRIENGKILRKKLFVGKEIEEAEKREQMMMRNRYEINRHYNQNTMLVREFNTLRQLNNKLEIMAKQAHTKLMAARTGGFTTRQAQTPRKKASSLVQLKKFSQKKMTPFQKHQLQFYDIYKNQNTSQTKVSKSNQMQSLSLLKTLIKDVDGRDSKYEKMQIIRNRIKSFVNPEVRIRKTLITQKLNYQPVSKKNQDNFE